MRSDEGRNSVRRRYALWYVQHEGSRSYVRVTRLGLFIVAIFTLIPMLLIFILFLRSQGQQQREIENVNVNITVPPQAPKNYEAPIIQPPHVAMPTPPKAGRSQRGEEPTRQTPAAPGLNANLLLPPSQTPSPTPPKPPG